MTIDESGQDGAAAHITPHRPTPDEVLRAADLRHALLREENRITAGVSPDLTAKQKKGFHSPPRTSLRHDLPTRQGRDLGQPRRLIILDPVRFGNTPSMFLPY
jgi:hypothetical protein